MAGYIYIMTNPALTNMVKIGFATDVENRRKQLSTSALPYEYEIYATYETPGKLEDKKLHKMIDNLNSELRVSANREFYVMSKEDAYELLEAIAVISGTQDKLKKYVLTQSLQQNIKKPQIDFFLCGLKDGDELTYVDDSSVKVIVRDNHKVEYKNELTSISAIAKELKGYSVSGSLCFKYKDELLTDLANRTQWANN